MPGHACRHTCAPQPRSACSSRRPSRAVPSVRTATWRRTVVVRAAGPGSGSQGEPDPFKWKIKRHWQASDGVKHLGSTQTPAISKRPFPGPPPSEGPPLRVLPIGGLGEIGMNCMLVGVRDRYILIDAGLMFPDMQDLGMQKILPDVSFLSEWRDKIEAVVITHGHEDHIGAMPWVVPALDPGTPIYAGAFVLQLVTRRLQEYNLYEPSRFHQMDMKLPFKAGPFEVTPIRVTHSIPDCCGLILRSDEGTIVHTGDWKIDEDPVDGEIFDRETFDLLSKEPISLMMSDSTNVLSPGRTSSERTVQDALTRWVMRHQGKGRVICTQFASNLHRIASVKAAADAAGRKICFIGTSLHTYLEAANRVGRAPLDPKSIIPVEALSEYNPNEVLVVTTGSQAEPRAQLSLASRRASNNLKILPSDLVLYSAKVIPGNDTQVAGMLNSLALLGAHVVQGRGENLHTSGHAYQEELVEVLRFVKPQHFLPVHGEYAFLCEHARLAKDKAEVNFTQVIRNGQMLGVHERRNRNTLSTGSMAVATLGNDMAVIGNAELVNFYNDGSRGTGTREEMAVDERTILAYEGVVVVAIDVLRTAVGAGGAMGGGRGPAPLAPNLRCQARVTTRGMWVDKGTLLDKLTRDVTAAVCRLPGDASLTSVERVAIDMVRKACRAFNSRAPEVIAVAYEHDPRYSHITSFGGPAATAPGGRGGGGRGQGPPGRGRGQWAAGGGRGQGERRQLSTSQQQGWSGRSNSSSGSRQFQPSPAAAAAAKVASPSDRQLTQPQPSTPAPSSSAAAAPPPTAAAGQGSRASKARTIDTLLMQVRQQAAGVEQAAAASGSEASLSPSTTDAATTSSPQPAPPGAAAAAAEGAVDPVGDSSAASPAPRTRTTAAQRRAALLAAAAGQAAAAAATDGGGAAAAAGGVASPSGAGGQVGTEEAGPVKRRRTTRSTPGEDGSSSSSSSRPAVDSAPTGPSDGNGSTSSAAGSRRRVSRRATDAAAPKVGVGSKTLPGLQVMSPEDMAAVKAKNPRQAPGARPGDDLAYD